MPEAFLTAVSPSPFFFFFCTPQLPQQSFLHHNTATFEHAINVNVSRYDRLRVGALLYRSLSAPSFQKKTMLTVQQCNRKTLQHQLYFHLDVYKAYLFLSFVIFTECFETPLSLDSLNHLRPEPGQAGLLPGFRGFHLVRLGVQQNWPGCETILNLVLC